MCPLEFLLRHCVSYWNIKTSVWILHFYFLVIALYKVTILWKEPVIPQKNAPILGVLVEETVLQALELVVFFCKYLSLYKLIILKNLNCWFFYYFFPVLELVDRML